MESKSIAEIIPVSDESISKRDLNNSQLSIAELYRPKVYDADRADPWPKYDETNFLRLTTHVNCSAEPHRFSTASYGRAYKNCCFRL